MVDTQSNGVGNQSIRCGLIGLGNHMLSNLFPALQSLGGVQLTAISSRSQEKLERFATLYPANVTAVTDWKTIVDSTLVDVIVVAASPDIHEQVVQLCAERNVNVYIEKPPATCTKALSDLVRMEAENETFKAFVGFNFRFGEAYQLLTTQKQLSREACARVRFISAKPRAPWLGYSSTAESYLYGVAIHAFDLVFSSFGEASRLSASWTVLDSERFALDVNIQFNSGQTAVLSLGNYSNRFEFDVEIIGEDGTYGTIRDQTSIELTLANASEAPGLGGKERLALALPSSRGGFNRAGYRGALESLLTSVRSGTPSLSPIRAVVPVYAAMTEALAQRRFVSTSIKRAIDHSQLPT